jgi:hypothetical protein
MTQRIPRERTGPRTFQITAADPADSLVYYQVLYGAAGQSWSRSAAS